MKKIKKIVAMTLLVAMLMPMAVSAASSTSYGSKVTMYAPDGRTISVSVYDVEKWKSVGWYDYPVTVMYAPDGRQEVIYTKEVPKWKSVGWYDYPVTTMYAPDGRQAVVYVGDVEKWKTVGWYEQPVSSRRGYTSTNSSYYPNTTIPSFDSYGTFLDQRFSGDNIIWIYYASVDNSNRYLSNLESNGFVLIAQEEENNIARLGYYKSSTNEIVAFAYDYKNSWFGITYHS